MKQRSFIYIFSLLAILFSLASCVDYSDATGTLTAQIQVQLPDNVGNNASLSDHTVNLQLNGQTYSAQTDANGIASFPGLVPDVYNASVSWDLTADEYARIIGAEQAFNGATVSGSLNAQLIANSDPLVMTTTIQPKTDLVISKIYIAGSRDNRNRAYRAGSYIEIYNQSASPINISGLYIGMLDTTSPQPYTLGNLNTAYADSMVVVKQIFRIPRNRDYTIAAGSSIVITNSAINHTVNAPNEHNLLQADFEAKDGSGKTQNNPDVPALEGIFTIYSAISNINFGTNFQGVIIFGTTDDLSQLQRAYAFGQTRGTQYGLIPTRYIIDGVDFLRNKVNTGPDVSEKRLYPTIDAGYTNITSTSGLTGEVVYRKTSATASDGRKTLVDTNNSLNDFQVSTTIAPRQYE